MYIILRKKIEYIFVILIHNHQPHQSYVWPYLKMPSKVIRMTNLCSRRQFPNAIANYLMEFIFHTVESLTQKRHYIIMNQIANAETAITNNDSEVGLFMFWASYYFHSPQLQAYFCNICGQYESTSNTFYQKAFRISCRGQGYRSCRILKYTNIVCECGKCECCKWTLNTA